MKAHLVMVISKLSFFLWVNQNYIEHIIPCTNICRCLSYKGATRVTNFWKYNLSQLQLKKFNTDYLYLVIVYFGIFQLVKNYYSWLNISFRQPVQILFLHSDFIIRMSKILTFCRNLAAPIVGFMTFYKILTFLYQNVRKALDQANSTFKSHVKSMFQNYNYNQKQEVLDFFLLSEPQITQYNANKTQQ